MMLLAIIGTFLVIISVYAYVVTRRYLELLDKIDDFKDVLGMSVEVLKDCHSSLDEKSKIEVFSDEPIIRDLVQDMIRARDAVLKINNVLDNIDQSIDDEEWDQQDDEKKTNE